MPDRLVDTVSREASDLAAIKAREAGVLAAIQRGDPEVDMGPSVFTWGQLRLVPVVADERGRLWAQYGCRLVLLGAAPTSAARQPLSEGSCNMPNCPVCGDAIARNGDG